MTLWICIILGVLVIVGGGIGFLEWQRSKHPKKKRSPTTEFLAFALLHAKGEGATEVVIAPAMAGRAFMIYTVGGKSHDLSSPHARVQPAIFAELARLANLPEGPFPKEGDFWIRLGGVPSKYRLRASSADAEWVLTPITI